MPANEATEESGSIRPMTKWPKVVQEMIEAMEHAISKAMDRDASPQNLAREAVIGLCNVLGGSVIYIPLGNVIDRKLRNESIYRAWQAGEQVDVLARKHRIALQTVYSIIARERKAAEQENKI